MNVTMLENTFESLFCTSLITQDNIIATRDEVTSATDMELRYKQHAEDSTRIIEFKTRRNICQKR